jgi:DNA-binding NarL/FixJ family response regulator
MAISVLVVEDEPAFLRQFSEAVLSDPELTLVGAVPTVRAALALLEVSAPDVALVDLGLPDASGLDVIRRLARLHPKSDALVISMFADDRQVLASIRAGATGYLLKDTPSSEIVAAIREIRAGGSPISPSIARRVLRSLRDERGTLPPTAAAARPVAASEGPAAEGASPGVPLSERELHILRLVAKGLSFQEVGEVLAISGHTVVSHVKSIYRKLAVHSRGEAVFEAGRMGLL